MSVKQTKRARIHTRIRARVMGTKDVPRLCVFKSAQHIYAQLIDDETGKVLVSASDIALKSSKAKKVEQSMEVGKLIAKEASAKKIEKVVFDRGGFLFHGRINAVADGAREGGLKFQILWQKKQKQNFNKKKLQKMMDSDQSARVLVVETLWLKMNLKPNY